MPVIRTLPPRWLARLNREELVDRLHRELGGEETPAPRPYIFQADLAESSQQAFVIWEEWKDVSPPERMHIIVDAYERWDRDGNDGPAIATILGIAVGATTAEAIRLNLLPFAVYPADPHPGWDQSRWSEINDALRPYGMLETRAVAYAAFPTREMRDRVWKSLSEKIPWGGWHRVEFAGDGVDR